MTYNRPWRSHPRRDRDLGQESSLMPSCHSRQHQVFELGGRTTANNRFVPVRCKILNFLPVSLNQSSFFGFFESSIMCKIGLGSRLGCRACCVSGMALSEGGFAFNTRLVYFVSEQVFPSAEYVKSALLRYVHPICHSPFKK